MQSARPFICLQVSRCISSSSICSNINREGRFMKKIMGGSHKSKRKWYDTDLHSASLNLTDKSPSKQTTRRMMMRDKLFMQHITDMLSMGEVAEILKESIEISHVKITADFKYVNVFYIPSNDDVSFEQEALQKCAKIIRHELSQLRVIGIVPPIQFVANKQYFKAMEIERKLAMINFEEDVETSCSEEMQFDTSDGDNVDQTSHRVKEDEFYTRLPAMRHDVLGLDRHRIMSQIISAVSKSKKTAQRRMLDANTVNDSDNTSEDRRDPVSKEAIKFVTREEQREIFSDFLKKRRKEERRKYKLNRSKQMSNNLEEVDNEKSDYIDDEINEYIDNSSIDENIDDVYINDLSEDETRK